MPEYNRPSEGAILRNSGCSSSNGSCPTCPNQPKSPSEWWCSFGPCSQLILLTILATSTLGNYVIDPVFPSLLGRAGGDVFLSEKQAMFQHLESSAALSVTSGMYSSFLPVSLAMTLTGCIRGITWPFRLLFDYGSPISLGFLISLFILSITLDKVERTICGEYLTEVFTFPGRSLFTEVTLPKTLEEEKKNVMVRSLRMIWLYTVMIGAIYGLGFLWGLAELVLCGVTSILSCVCASAMPRWFGGAGVDEFLIIGDEYKTINAGISLDYVTIIPHIIFVVVPRILHTCIVVARPTQGMVIGLTTMWCFLEPKSTIMKIPFASLFTVGNSSHANAPPSTTNNGTASSEDTQRRQQPLTRNVDPKTGLKKEPGTVSVTTYPFLLVGVHCVMSLMGGRNPSSLGVSSRVVPVTLMSVVPDLLGLLIGYELAFMLKPSNRYQIPRWFVVGRDVVCVVLEGLLAILRRCRFNCRNTNDMRNVGQFDEEEYKRKKREILNKMKSGNNKIVEDKHIMCGNNDINESQVVTGKLNEDITTETTTHAPTISNMRNANKGLSADALQRIWAKSEARRRNHSSVTDSTLKGRSSAMQRENTLKGNNLPIKENSDVLAKDETEKPKVNQKIFNYFSLFSFGGFMNRAIYNMTEQTRNTAFIPLRDLDVPLCIYMAIKRYNSNRYKKKKDRGHLTPWVK
eukprot:Tbor_TRINITY_DN369_c0_g1::TRINITY_DN369_c0_g1_i1::g.15524::m.15524